ncbi:MAG: outer membrane beta-barrel protein [Planctomycetota bacterium]|nr:outer membrane beta-barrel protein [Planctomycetota bacterium]
MNTPRTLYTSLLLPGLLLSACSATGDDGGSFQVDDGLYLRAGLTHARPSGSDFDGDLALVGSSEVIFIPKIDDGEGMDYAIGYRIGGVGFELAYQNLDFDGSLGGTPGFDMSRSAYDLNMRFNFLRERRVQPYFQFGLGYVSAELEDVASDGYSTYDADLSGLCLPVGGGIEFFATPHVSLDLRAVNRFAYYGDANGTPIEDKLDGDSFELGIGLTLSL